MTRELPTPSPARLRFLARQTHRLGERPLYELLLEVRDGADLWDRLEAYARLAPIAGFVVEHGGDRLPPPHLVVDRSGGRHGRHG